jgi:hypothetical protein
VTHHNRGNIPGNNIESTIARETSIRGRNYNNRNPISKRKYTANQTRMPLFRIFANRNIFQPRHRNWPDRAESPRSLTLDRFIFTTRLGHDRWCRNPSHPRHLPNDLRIPSTFMAMPCHALPRRAADTTRSALEGVGPKLSRSG